MLAINRSLPNVMFARSCAVSAVEARSMYITRSMHTLLSERSTAYMFSPVIRAVLC